MDLSPGPFKEPHPGGSSRIRLPPEWHSYVHPEGAVYWHHPITNTITSAHLMKKGVYEQINRWYRGVCALAAQNEVNLPQRYDLVLELDAENPDICQYYYADHDTCTVFWLQPLSSSDDLELPYLSTSTHLKLKLEEEYWFHLEYFPMHFPLSESQEEDLVIALATNCADSLTSPTSTSPYSVSECEKFLNLANQYISGRKCGSRTWFFARMIRLFTRARFLNFYGEEHARLDRTQQIEARDPIQIPEWLLSGSQIALFNTPNNYLLELQALWTDKVAYADHWHQFLEKAIRDWSEARDMAKAVWIVDMLFLLLPSTSRIQRGICLCAMMSAVGSIVTGIYYIRYYRSHLQFKDGSLSASFLENAEHPTLGFFPLAVLFSVPFVLLMWSILGFLLACTVFAVSAR
ncbi:hypothetical protein BOTBODRAFT_384973 [Botryobasidium botryosum FD-172 SS1]|uniref:WW domain-containing protein n=1 Tax=Botryobasidium botryosum (strain FD-172 SS1) TaxID=930990 RepID=A0A067N8C8_BOTB1|nr:hypothetical protein BOTBODRAFT_384973 [Botryobasidium botryosum FD-172 SS1]